MAMGQTVERAAAVRISHDVGFVGLFGAASALIVHGRDAQAARGGPVRGGGEVPTMRDTLWG